MNNPKFLFFLESDYGRIDIVSCFNSRQFERDIHNNFILPYKVETDLPPRTLLKLFEEKVYNELGIYPKEKDRFECLDFDPEYLYFPRFVSYFYNPKRINPLTNVCDFDKNIFQKLECNYLKILIELKAYK